MRKSWIEWMWTWWKARAPYLWRTHARSAVWEILHDAGERGASSAQIWVRAANEYRVPGWCCHEALMSLRRERLVVRDRLMGRWYASGVKPRASAAEG